jgi:glycosyltransferase involved in cell wall biosynthesis
VLFPFLRPFSLVADRRLHGKGLRHLRVTLRQWLYRKGWRKRLTSYHAQTSISEFVRRWTKVRWRTETRVLYPPAAPHLVSTKEANAKKNLILSVGRFSIEAVSKRQMEMMDVFRKMVLSGQTDWRFTCAGGVGESSAEKHIFEAVRRLGEGVNGEARANLTRSELETLYSEGKIFWHAAGLGEVATTHPELSEHYGIATVEAMTAGCVPIVINKGAQPEIVEHGVSGFLWDSLEELRDYTLTLMRDDSLREKMAKAAQDRAARYFSRERFEQDFARILESVCGHSGTERLDRRTERETT